MNEQHLTIPTIDLGDGLTVSRIGFGGMALSPVYGGIDDAAAERTLAETIDAGITFIDTADVYGAPRPGVWFPPNRGGLPYAASRSRAAVFS